MIAPAYPEANRLSYRIRTAITGESTGLEIAKLAWQQAEAIDRANADLARSLQALKDGRLLDCLLIENAHPKLLETARSFDQNLIDAWQKRCEIYSWRVAVSLDIDSVSKIQSAIDEQGDLKDWLYKQYRTAVRSKKETVRAYQIINLIANRFPEDESAKEQVAAKRQQLLEQAAAEVKDAHDQLIPAEKPEQVVLRYQTLGLPLSDSNDETLSETLAEAEANSTGALFEQAATVIEQAKDLSETGNWQETEKTYLAAEYALAIHEARGELPPELRGGFEELATQLSRIRSNYESSISIRLAIDEVQSGRIDKGKPVNLANRVAKLKSLEAQAAKTGSKIPTDLQEEIKAAYAYARRKRLPLYGSIAAVLVFGIFASFFILKRGQERDAAEALQARALTALQAVEQSSQISEVQKALDQWQSEIEKTPSGSELESQADLLSDWLAIQTSLENEYTTAVADLAKLTESPDALENQAAIERISANIRKTRSDLASDLGQEGDKQFDSLLAGFEVKKAEALAENRRAFNRIERELRIAANNATQAKTRAEFERLQTATDTRVQKLTNLLKEDYAADKRAQLLPFLQSVAQQLQATETKWAALDNAWQQLAQTKELQPYLDQIERIQSFDILPADQKTALGQTLRLKEAFLELKESHNPFADEAAQTVFSTPEPYLSTAVKLSDEESAYLDRIEALEGFANVYQSTVKYFEGSADPQNEYRIYLVEPVAKSDSHQSETHVSFTFSVRGFDEFGNPEPEPRQIQFISRQDGSFWGFFYEPSSLSPESQYYSRAIVNTLKLLRSGAGRLTVLELLHDLENQESLSPAFRVFWQQQIIGFMQLNPWNWGLALSPTLEDRIEEVDTLPSAQDNETLWLSIIEQTVPSAGFSAFVSKSVAEQAKREVRVLADLYQKAASGSYRLSGFVLENGKADLFDEVESDTTLWSVNALTGEIEAIESGKELTPFAPIIRYALPDGGTPQEQLREASLTSNLELSEPPYHALLPKLYQ